MKTAFIRIPADDEPLIEQFQAGQLVPPSKLAAAGKLIRLGYEAWQRTRRMPDDAEDER